MRCTGCESNVGEEKGAGGALWGHGCGVMLIVGGDVYLATCSQDPEVDKNGLCHCEGVAGERPEGGPGGWRPERWASRALGLANQVWPDFVFKSGDPAAPKQEREEKNEMGAREGNKRAKFWAVRLRAQWSAERPPATPKVGITRTFLILLGVIFDTREGQLSQSSG